MAMSLGRLRETWDNNPVARSVFVSSIGLLLIGVLA